jgi:5-methylcytosine-specific restriction enzyme A
MKIGELHLPVTATKADWLPGTTWLGFTPTGVKADARAKCEAKVNQQMAGGLVLERITQTFEKPRPGYENHPRVVEDRKVHGRLADRLIAVHELRPSARPLRAIVGEDEYEQLQDIWSDPAQRNRWSVAFPIVRTWEIIEKPKAHDVLSASVFSATYQSQNALLRSVSDRMREEISDLRVQEIPAPNVWIAVEDEVEIASLDNIPSSLQHDINKDLINALEGEETERKVKLKRRAAWLGQRFWFERKKASTLQCDDCGFDPATKASSAGLPTRSLFDIHHKNPMAEGVRRTTTQDLALLCPTCHRIEHVRLRKAAQT